MENASTKYSHREDIKKKFTLHVYIQINLFSWLAILEGTEWFGICEQEKEFTR